MKWAGGKSRLVERIAAELPPAPRLIEPFVGSAAVSLNLAYARYVLGDTNRHLIEFYEAILDGGDTFIERCACYFQPEYNNADRFYELRERFNQTDDVLDRAAIFLYLNRHGYNGLYRVNQKGIFNVPFGRYKHPSFPADAMRRLQQRADRIELGCRPFAETMAMARRGDAVYCDPPYVPLTSTADFTAYTSEGFGPDEQRALVAAATQCAAGGATVVISNHDTAFTREIYHEARLSFFSVRRLISRDGNNRGMAGELLAVYEPRG